MILLCHISIWYYFEKDILNSVHVLWWQSHDKLSDGSVMIGLPNRTNNTDISMAIKHQIFHFVAHSIGSQKCINHFAKALKSHHLRIFNCTCFHYFYTKFLRWVENGYLSTEDDQKQEQRKRFEVWIIKDINISDRNVIFLSLNSLMLLYALENVHLLQSPIIVLDVNSIK